MFDHRLGSLLRRSIGEVHQLSYSEYRSWKLFYSVEPWGYQPQEFRLARLLALLVNIYKPKNAPLVQPSEFMINASQVIENEEAEREMRKEFKAMSFKERRAFVLREAGRMFGVKPK